MVSVIVCVLVFGSFTTARARQAWDADQARIHQSSARMSFTGALRYAESAGLTPSEMAPYRAAGARLEAAKAPPSGVLWDSASSDFYQRQAATYTRLAADVRREISVVTDDWRTRTTAALQVLQRTILTAGGLMLDTTSQMRLLRTDTRTARKANTPRQLQVIFRDLEFSRHGLDAAVASRQAYIKGVAPPGSTVATVTAHSDAEVASESDRLSLMTLVSPKGKAYASELEAANAAVHAQKDPKAAAVREIRVHDLVAEIDANFGRIVPAKVILVSTEAQWAHMYENGKEVYSTPVTTGGPELPTDLGVFQIYEKVSPFVFHSPWPIGSEYYYPPTPVTFWMPFDGAEGLHDASWRSNFGPGSNYAPTDLGTGVSILGTHGCVNLPYDAAQFVWDWAPIGTTVVVV